MSSSEERQVLSSGHGSTDATLGRRLVVVAPDFHPTTGGYAHAVTNLVRLVAPHVPITVLCSIPLNGAAELDCAGLEVVRLTAAGWQLASGAWDVRAAEWLQKRVATGDVRAILLETAEKPVLGLRALRMGVPVLLRVHAAAETELAFHEPRPLDRRAPLRSVWRSYHYAMMRRLVRRAPVVLSTNPYHLDFVKRVALRGNSVAISRRSFYVVPNVTTRAAGASSPLPPPLEDLVNRRYLLTLGRLDEQGVAQKGVHDLLGAFALARRHDPSLGDVRLVVAGDGDQRSALLGLAERLGLADAAVFPGSLPHQSVIALTQHAHAVVLLSRYEGQAMFALESLSLGAPLILTDTGGLSELVDHGKNGLLVPPQDVPAAAAAIIEALGSRRQDMSQRSASLFRERFAPERTLETILDVLDLVAPVDVRSG